MLTKYLINRPRNQWDLYLDQALFASRVRTHSTTRFSPFFLLYGRHPRLPTDESGLTPLTNNVREDRQPMFETIRAEAYRNTVQRAETNKQAWQRTVVPVEYKPGDFVLVRAEGQRKYEGNWFGPYTVVRSAPLNTYQLKTPRGQVLERLISGDRSRRARVSSRVTRGWRMPKGDSRRRLENNPELPITVTDESFEPLPPSIDDVEPLDDPERLKIRANTAEPQL